MKQDLFFILKLFRSDFFVIRFFNENHDHIEKLRFPFVFFTFKTECYQNEQKPIFSRDLKYWFSWPLKTNQWTSDLVKQQCIKQSDLSHRGQGAAEMRGEPQQNYFGRPCSEKCHYLHSLLLQKQHAAISGPLQTSGCEITAQRKSFKRALFFKEKFSNENTHKYVMVLFLYQKGTRLDYNTQFEKTGEVRSDPFSL